MNDWSEGYFTEVDYQMAYVAELNPVRASFALQLAGLDPVPPGPCCELGFGRGLSLALHATADDSRAWWGTDFSPAQVLDAQDLIDAAGTPAALSEQGFKEFCVREDLPRFAFIGLHGVWSWVSAENRSVIVKMLQHRLLPGGVVYISYNALPGALTQMPIRQLLNEHTRWAGSPGDPGAERLQQALAFARRVLGAAPEAARSLPSLGPRLAALQGRDPAYLLHEYMNSDWQADWFADVAQTLQAAKLDFGCSAALQDRVRGVHLSPVHEALLDGISQPRLRETVQDICLDRNFRRDLFVRGVRRRPPAEQRQRIAALPVVLGVDPADVPDAVTGVLGTARLDPHHLAAVVGALAEAQGPLTLGALAARVRGPGLEDAHVVGIVTALVGNGAIYPAQVQAPSEQALAACARLNRHLLGPTLAGGSTPFLASPVTGGGVVLPTELQSFVSASQRGPGGVDDWSSAVWQAMGAAGDELQFKGQPVHDATQAQHLLRPMAEKVRDVWLPVLKRLQVV